MIPILYESTERAFTHNGIARLRDCIDCKVSEERNGAFECEFTYPVSGSHYEDIIPGRIIGVTHDNSGDIQPFDIVSYSRGIDGLTTFHAVHTSYRLSHITVTGSNITSLTDAFTLFASGVPESDFTFETDMTSSGYLGIADGLPHSVKEMLGGVEGSVLDVYGGEYTWDRFRVILRKNRGVRRDFIVRYGVNMTEFTDDTDCSDVYNACIPFYNGTDGPVVGNEVVLDQPTFNGRELCVPLDLSDRFETQPTAAQVEAEARSYMEQNKTYLPSQNIKVGFLRLQDFPGFEEYEDLLECGLCDVITVEFPGYGIRGDYKVVKAVWDVLEGRFEELELGSVSVTLAQALGIQGVKK